MELHVAAQKLFGFNLHRHIHRHLRDHFIPHEGNKHIPHVLHHRVLFLYSVFLVLVKLSVLVLPVFIPFNQAELLSITPENVIQLTNQSRSDFDLLALRESPKLAVAAMNKASDMMKRGYFAHYSPDGVSPWYWITQAGFDYTFAGENLAIRFSTAEGVNEAWLASPAHRANILSKDFTEIGVAVITDNFGNEGMATLVVQMFGRSPQAGAVAAKPVPAAKPADEKFVAVQKSAKDSAASLVTISGSAPQVTFPMKNSFVNNAHFRIIGVAAAGDSAAITVDGKKVGSVTVGNSRVFEFTLPDAMNLAQGAHEIYAEALDKNDKALGRSETVAFTLDTLPPEIYPEKFSMTHKIEDSKTYQVKAGVAADSIRTIVSVGKESAVLAKAAGTDWAGEIKLYSLVSGQNVPVELYAQDFAGNDNKKRVGELTEGGVREVFNFVRNSPLAGEKQVSLFGGLLSFPNYNESVKNLYLYFVIFLALVLIMKMVIKRQVQHPMTITASSAVMVLAMLLFAV